jgi:hypothetical protein
MLNRPDWQAPSTTPLIVLNNPKKSRIKKAAMQRARRTSRAAVQPHHWYALGITTSLPMQLVPIPDR